ncbi:NUDIX hydrolase [Paenibacillus segetis]|uniref:DNA mismatch repair protein MutT n=1 Tax=Paenibacillus segetis TaxID=1325360 RepID=A0ABQ1YKM6_9BACL|nr:NUDIX hydrolase [Paenibacillus segetis]GGH27670.1 DNA mismatch repair protein MutT [Paenibacillus segetis]
MITFERNNNKFNFRVAGILIHNGKLLLHTTKTDDFWNLPGGRVEFNESTEQALIRELQEELGVTIQLERLVYVNEDFFEYDCKKYHEIGFYYLMSLPANHDILQKKEEFYGLEDNGRLIFKWFEVEELLDLEVYPEILKTDIKEIITGSGIKHSVIRQ